MFVLSNRLGFIGKNLTWDAVWMRFDLEGLLKKIWQKDFKESQGSLDYSSCLFIIRKAINKEDIYTYGHSIQVGKYAYLIGSELGMESEELKELTVSALLHDIGKTKIPLEIILKKDSLLPEEYKEMKKHVFFGAEMVREQKIAKNLYCNILYHHERWDGDGYPFGLKAEEIPLISRIICLADSFDAMTSNRPYRSHLTKEKALQELIKNTDKQFDGELVRLFTKIIQGQEIKAGKSFVK